MGVFDGLVFFCVAGLEKKPKEWQGDIEQHGGVLAKSMTKKVTHYVTTKDEAYSPTARYTKAKQDGVAMVTEAFLVDSLAKGKLQDSSKYDSEKAVQKRPASPPTKPAKRAKKQAAPSPPPSPPPAPSPASTVVSKTIVKKGRAAVDEYFPDKDSYHVYEEGSDVYNVMMNQTDVSYNVKGHNKYYGAQLLESDHGNKYAVWTRWGRVGAKGQNAAFPNLSLAAAKDTFCKKFYDKTRNQFSDRANFVFVPGKYDLVETTVEDEDEPAAPAAPAKGDEPKQEVKSTLPESVQSLIQLICNVKTYEQTVLEMKYDANKMPLGKLTKAQVQKGYEALKAIETLIQAGKYSGRDLTGACNLFYTRIPHDFGMAKPPLITDMETVKRKLELLETLGDIEIAMKVLKDASKVVTENPIDARYHQLNTQIRPVTPTAEEYQIVKEYLKNTHGHTHTQYTLELEDLFAVDRHGEPERFKQQVGNVQLLWHGSRLTNFVGILSQGLRIAPPEAPVTGYMFGKGVYFADMVTKSANYCFATPTNNTGLLLLCEVALGKPNELLDADYTADRLPPGCHSTKGLGKTAPDPKGCRKLGGVTVPMGSSVDTGVNNPRGYALQYNEYIVYDVSQIRIKYLLRCSFNYKR